MHLRFVENAISIRVSFCVVFLHIVISHQKAGSPAMTIKVNSFSIDLVPAVCLMEWPEPARSWTSEWLGTTKSTEIASEAHAVAKIHPSGERFAAHSKHIKPNVTK